MIETIEVATHTTDMVAVVVITTMVTTQATNSSVTSLKGTTLPTQQACATTDSHITTTTNVANTHHDTTMRAPQCRTTAPHTIDRGAVSVTATTHEPVMIRDTLDTIQHKKTGMTQHVPNETKITTDEDTMTKAISTAVATEGGVAVGLKIGVLEMIDVSILDATIPDHQDMVTKTHLRGDSILIEVPTSLSSRVSGLTFGWEVMTIIEI